MKTTNLLHQRLPQKANIFWKSFHALATLNSSIFCECSSHFNHDFCLSLLANEIRHHDFTQMCKSVPASGPYVCLFSWSQCIFMRLIIDKATKYIINPIDKILVGVRDLNVGLVIRKISLWITTKVSNVYTSFTVNNPRKIGYVGFFILFSPVFESVVHGKPIMNGTTTIQYNTWNAQPQRLSPLALDSGGCDSLNCLETCRGRSEAVLPPIYYRSLKVTDPIEFNSICQNQDPVLNECAARLGVSLRQTEDQLISSMLASTASFINCVGGVNGDSPTEVSRTDVDNVVRQLLNNNAYTITEGIEGEDRFGTAPVRNAYFALGSTQLTGNLDNVAGFTQVNQYPSNMKALESEWGAIGNLRFLLSPIGSFTPNASNLGANVYNIFCTGLEAYAFIEQDGYSASFIYRPPIYDGPLALNASVGYKFAQVPRITNDLWVINLRATLAV